MVSKLRQAPQAALDGLLVDGMTIMSGGFGRTGLPEHLISAIEAADVGELTLVANGAGGEDYGFCRLLSQGRVRRLIVSFVGGNRHVGELYEARKLELELTPQGTLAERIRAGGAGIPAFFTATGVGTEVAEGKEVRVFDGRRYLLERALTADLAIVRAWRGDVEGNLCYRKAARNFNPLMATAARKTVAQVSEVVSVGDLDKEAIHTAGLYVDRLVEVRAAGAAGSDLVEGRT